MNKDEIGTRMKGQYESRAKFMLPRRTYTIIRLDGKNFHTYTKHLDKPYDKGLMTNFEHTARFLCQEVQGAKLAYTQSDEINLLLTDWDTIQTEAWFDGNVQKMASVSASMATAKFNAARTSRDLIPRPLAIFDSRVFTIPDPVEVENYFVWRLKDCERNSISLLAHEHYSHRELKGKSTNERQEMLWQKGINWNDAEPRFKRGIVVYPVLDNQPLTFTHKLTGQTETVEAERRVWRSEPASMDFPYPYIGDAPWAFSKAK